MQTGSTAGAADDRRFEVVKDDFAGTALEEFQGIHYTLGQGSGGSLVLDNGANPASLSVTGGRKRSRPP